MEMTRSIRLSRPTVLELLALLGSALGFWLVVRAFAAPPNAPGRLGMGLLVLGGLDIIACFALLGYALRLRRATGAPLPVLWRAAGVVVPVALLCWSVSQSADLGQLQEQGQTQTTRRHYVESLEGAVRSFAQALPRGAPANDAQHWHDLHERSWRVYEQLRYFPEASADLENELARIDADVREMQRIFAGLLDTAVSAEQREKGREEFFAHEVSVLHLIQTMLGRIADNGATLDARLDTARARLAAVGLLAGLLLLGGAGLFVTNQRSHPRIALVASPRVDNPERCLVEQCPDLLLRLDAAGTIEYASLASLALLGCEPGELVGRNLADLLHPEDAESAYPMQALGDGAYHECRLLRKDGSWGAFESKGAALKSDVPAQVLSVREIGARKQAVEADRARAAAKVAELELLAQAFEEQWRESDRDYRNLFEQLPHAAFRLARDGQLVSANNALAELCGFVSEDELRAAFRAGSFTLHLQTPIMCSFQDHVRAHAPFDCQSVTLSHRDGRVVRAALYAWPINDESGQPVAWQGVVVDRSELVDLQEDFAKREADLVAREQAVSRTLAAVPVLAVVCDRSDERCLWTSDEWHAELGYDPGFLAADDNLLVKLFHPDDLPLLRQDMDRAGGGDRTETDLRIRDARGTWHWCATRCRAVPGADNRIVVTAFDVTIHRNAADELRASGARCRTLLEGSRALLFSVTADGSLRDLNEAWTRTLGYGRKELVGRTLHDLVPTEDAAKVDALLQPEEGSYWVELRLVAKGDRVVWVQGRCQRGCGVLVDLSERRRIEEALRDAVARGEALLQSVDGLVWEGTTEPPMLTGMAGPMGALLGHAPEDWQRSSEFLEGLLHPDDRSSFGAALEQALATSGHCHFSVRLLAADGQSMGFRGAVCAERDGEPPHQWRALLIPLARWDLTLPELEVAPPTVAAVTPEPGPPHVADALPAPDTSFAGRPGMRSRLPQPMSRD